MRDPQPIERDAIREDEDTLRSAIRHVAEVCSWNKETLQILSEDSRLLHYRGDLREILEALDEWKQATHKVLDSYRRAT